MKPLLIILMLGLLLPQQLQARSLTPLEGLERLRQAFAGISDFSAELHQEKQLSIMKKKLIMQGTIRFKKPDRFIMELAPPHAGTVLLKDTILEQRLGVRGERQRIVLPPEQGLSRWFASFDKPLSSIPPGMEVTAEQQGGITSVVIRPAPGGQLKEVTIVLQQDGTVRRLVLVERAGDRTVMNFYKTRKNIGLTEDDFRLE